MESEKSNGLFCDRFDHNEAFSPGRVYDTTDVEREQAESVMELAGKLGLDPKSLKQIVEEFHSACNSKPFELMKLDGKATTGLEPNKTDWANPIDNPPSYRYIQRQQA